MNMRYVRPCHCPTLLIAGKVTYADVAVDTVPYKILVMDFRGGQRQLRNHILTPKYEVRSYVAMAAI